MSQASLDQLYKLKFQKLREQQNVSKKMFDILNKSGGLIENSKVTLKNLNAAIATSKQPGYFDYHVAPDDVKRVEERKVLNGLAREVQKLHAELEHINGDIANYSAQLKTKQSEPPMLNSLNQWFEMYGKPSMTEEKRDMLTKFEKNSKIYGGTKHYDSFKTRSTKMIKGKIAVPPR